MRWFINQTRQLLNLYSHLKITSYCQAKRKILKLIL